MGFKEKFQLVRIEREKFVAALDTKSFDFQISTWFGSGLIIPAPGTWGTIGGMIFGVPLLLLTNSMVVFLVGLILFFVGLKSVERIEKKLENHDPSFIVIDEVAAILLLIGLLPHVYIGFSLISIFILFRFFDAKKPWLIGLADRKIKGAMGVMIDDIVAAIFSIVAFYCIYFPLVLVLT